MEKSIKKFQKIFNLNIYEAKIYASALNFEHANLTELAKAAGIPRTAAYKPIQQLVDKGFLSIVKQGKRKYYQALDPKSLHFILDRKKVDLDELVNSLSKQPMKSDGKNMFNYFSGPQGIAIAGDIFLENAKTKDAKSFENVIPTLKNYGWQLNDYIDRRVKKGIKGKMIASGTVDSKLMEKLLKRDKKELRKSIMVSPRTYPIKASMAVLDDMVLIFTLGKEPFAVLIKNKDVAETMNSIHDMVWDRFEV